MRRWPIILAALLVAAPVGARAADDGPEPRRATIFLRALAFDRNLTKRAEQRVVVAVLVPRPRVEAPAFEAFLTALTGLQKLTVKSLPLTIVTLELGEVGALDAALAEAHVTALLVGPGLAAKVPELAEATRRRHVLSMAWSLEEQEKGLCLGVDFEGARPRIHVRLPACTAEGVAFESQMLDLAKVTR